MEKKELGSPERNNELIIALIRRKVAPLQLSKVYYCVIVED